jgi:outer membrane protein
VAVAEVKVGFVNVSRLLEQAPQAVHAYDKLEKEFAPRNRDLVAVQREALQLEDRLLRDGANMTDAERISLEQDVRERRREVKRQQDELRGDYNLRRNQEVATIQRTVLEAVRALAKRESYDLVVTDGVVFASGRVDITDKVLERLRQQGAPQSVPD